MSQDLLMAPISAGELIDKITILELKQRHISTPEKLANVSRELEELMALWTGLGRPDTLNDAIDGLREVNAALWAVEDRLRAYEAAADFGQEFVAAARSVYKLNDRRAALKYDINRLMGSRLVEEKAYSGTR